MDCVLAPTNVGITDPRPFALQITRTISSSSVAHQMCQGFQMVQEQRRLLAVLSWCLLSRSSILRASKTTETRGFYILVLSPKTRGFQKPGLVGSYMLIYHMPFLPYHILYTIVGSFCLCGLWAPNVGVLIIAWSWFLACSCATQDPVLGARMDLGMLGNDTLIYLLGCC